MDELIYTRRPSLQEPRMVLGFTGWMDGGDVSTGSIDFLAQATRAAKFAEIASPEFYIHHLPIATLPITVVSDGEETVVRPSDPMDQAAVFRPHTEIVDGVIRSLTFPQNDFLCSEDAGLVLFTGEEPHVRWFSYAECVLNIAEEYGIREIYFVGSVGGPIPHTRPPRLRSAVSAEHLKSTRKHPEVGFSNYQGPSGIVTYLMTRAAERGIDMRTLVVEIPHYPFLASPTYPGSILKCMTVLGEWLDLDLPLESLQDAADSVGQQFDELMRENAEFRDLVKGLEAAYDAEEASVGEELLRRLVDRLDLDGDNGNL